MIRVLDVSIVALWAAEATFEVVTPQTLKAAIETIIPIESQIMVKSSPICLKA